MEVIGRDNNMKIGLREWPKFTEAMLGELTAEKIEAAIPAERLRKTRRVLVTGCGDSYAATLATKSLGARMFCGRDYHALRTIDVSRNYIFDRGEDLSETLVIVISVSGTGARVAEAMTRARRAGCTTLAITGNAQSRMALEAEHVLELSIPKLSGYTIASQIRSYFTAVLTTAVIALHAGVALGAITQQEAEAERAEMLRYVSAVAGDLDRVDDQIYALAHDWKDAIGFDFVGAGCDFATAYFGSAKFFEYIGALCCLNDSEDWCHINYFMRRRDEIGSIVVASKNGPSFSRSVETIASMHKSGRRVLVVTDADASAFIEGVTVCTLPATDHEHITSLMNGIPLCMLGNYLAILNGLEYFGGTGPENPLFSQDGGINTIKSSRIVLVD